MSNVNFIMYVIGLMELAIICLFINAFTKKNK